MRTHIGRTKLRIAAHPVINGDGLCVDERSDGYYWKAKGARDTRGPFGSLVDALDDIQREAGSDLVGEPEDWLDDVGYESAYPA
jgi:hypothetical protein